MSIVKFGQKNLLDFHVSPMVNLYVVKEITCKTIRITHRCNACHRHSSTKVSFQPKGAIESF